MNSLLEAELQEVDQKEQFAVTNPEQANWALRKIRAFQAKVHEVTTLARNEHDRIDAWQKEQTAQAEDSIAFFTRLLEAYHRAELEKDPKAKTIKLPHGQLQMRAQQPEFIRNEAILRPWVEKNRPDCLIPQEAKLDWAGLKQTIGLPDMAPGTVSVTVFDTATGETIPGVMVDYRPPKFSVKVEA